MSCGRCGKKFEGYIFALCSECLDIVWEKWKTEEADNLRRIKEIQAKGHSYHCACRQVWENGKCERGKAWRFGDKGRLYTPFLCEVW